MIEDHISKMYREIRNNVDLLKIQRKLLYEQEQIVEIAEKDYREMMFYFENSKREYEETINPEEELESIMKSCEKLFIISKTHYETLKKELYKIQFSFFESMYKIADHAFSLITYYKTLTPDDRKLSDNDIPDMVESILNKIYNNLQISSFDVLKHQRNATLLVRVKTVYDFMRTLLGRMREVMEV